MMMMTKADMGPLLLHPPKQPPPPLKIHYNLISFLRNTRWKEHSARTDIKILTIFFKSQRKAQMRYVHVVANRHANYKGRQIFRSRTCYFYLRFPGSFVYISLSRGCFVFFL
jgi:hypothetical protein